MQPGGSKNGKLHWLSHESEDSDRYESVSWLSARTGKSYRLPSPRFSTREGIQFMPDG